MKQSPNIQLMSVSFGFALFVILTAGCVVREEVVYRGGPPPPAPPPPAYQPTYAYDYYPDTEVYFYPVTGIYFWFEGGVWVSGRRLPPRIVLAPRSRVEVRLNGDRPYIFHDRVRTQHPPRGGPPGGPPQREKPNR